MANGLVASAVTNEPQATRNPEHDAPDAWHALELSSFQLDTVETLRADLELFFEQGLIVF